MNDHLMADEWTAPRRIVVGVDGSPNSVAAVPRCLDRALCPVDICADQAVHVS
jgi:hypothetical protein